MSAPRRWHTLDRVVAAIKVDSAIYVGDLSGLYISKDNGLSWDCPGITDTHVGSFAVKGNTIFASSWDKGIFRSTDNGLYWKKVNNGLSQTNIFSFASLDSILYAVTSNTGLVFYSNDNGDNWHPTTKGLYGADVVKIEAYKSNLIACSELQGIYHSTNSGASWNLINRSFGDSAWVRDIAVSGNNIYIATYKGIYRSQNNGESWNNCLPNKQVVSIAASGSRVVASVPDIGIPISNDYGATWNNSWNRRYFPGTVIFVGNNIFASSSEGMFLLRDKRSTWEQINTGLPAETIIYALTVKDNYLFAGTYGKGIWRISLDELLR